MKLRKFKGPLPLKYLLPNLVTLIGLVVGVSSIRFALESRWEVTIICILIAVIIDGIDGKIARLLNATSIFGAELDSLCDFANFGIAPAVVIYLWSLQQFDYNLLLWCVVLIFIVCMAIRLARFNTSIHDPAINNNKIFKHFSIGVPAPFGALLAVMPIMLEFDLDILFNLDIRSHIIIILLYILFVGFLMASRIPTLSLKNISVKPEFIWMILLAMCIIIISSIMYPWYVIPIISIIYICTIPVTALVARRIN